MSPHQIKLAGKAKRITPRAQRKIDTAVTAQGVALDRLVTLVFLVCLAVALVVSV